MYERVLLLLRTELEEQNVYARAGVVAIENRA